MEIVLAKPCECSLFTGYVMAHPPKPQDESTTAFAKGVKSMGKSDPKPGKKMKKVAKAMVNDAKDGRPKSKV